MLSLLILPSVLRSYSTKPSTRSAVKSIPSLPSLPARLIVSVVIVPPSMVVLLPGSPFGPCGPVTLIPSLPITVVPSLPSTPFLTLMLVRSTRSYDNATFTPFASAVVVIFESAPVIDTESPNFLTPVEVSSPAVNVKPFVDTVFAASDPAWI